MSADPGTYFKALIDFNSTNLSMSSPSHLRFTVVDLFNNGSMAHCYMPRDYTLYRFQHVLLTVIGIYRELPSEPLSPRNHGLYEDYVDNNKLRFSDPFDPELTLHCVLNMMGIDTTTVQLSDFGIHNAPWHGPRLRHRGNQQQISVKCYVNGPTGRPETMLYPFDATTTAAVIKLHISNTTRPIWGNTARPYVLRWKGMNLGVSNDAEVELWDELDSMPLMNHYGVKQGDRILATMESSLMSDEELRLTMTSSGHVDLVQRLRVQVLCRKHRYNTIERLERVLCRLYGPSDDSIHHKQFGIWHVTVVATGPPSAAVASIGSMNTVELSGHGAAIPAGVASANLHTNQEPPIDSESDDGISAHAYDPDSYRGMQGSEYNDSNDDAFDTETDDGSSPNTIDPDVYRCMKGSDYTESNDDAEDDDSNDDADDDDE